MTHPVSSGGAPGALRGRGLAMQRVLLLAAFALPACSDEAERFRVDAAGEEPSLCTPDRDPDRSFCDASGRLSSLDALKLAAPKIGDAKLIRVYAPSYHASMNVDGKAVDWDFGFDRAGAGVEIAIEKRAVKPPAGSGPTYCDAGLSTRPLDSVRIVHDAIRRFERHTRQRYVQHAGLSLLLFQSKCGAPGDIPEDHHVEIQTAGPADADGGTTTLRYFARYWDDGTFIELVGPCSPPGYLTSCLYGSEN